MNDLVAPVRLMRARQSGNMPAALGPGQVMVDEYLGRLVFGDATTAPNASGQYTSFTSIGLKDLQAALTAVRSLAAGGTGVAAASSADLLAKLGAEASANKGQANGYAGLGSDGKLPTAIIPSALLTALEFNSTWDANANSPALASGAGTKGQIYVVATAGTTALDGLGAWSVGDWAIFDGAKWRKIDGLATEVISVAGLVGAVTAAALKTALAIAAGDVSGLGTAATRNVGTSSGTVAAGDDARFSAGGGLPTAFATKSANYTVAATDAGTQFTLTGSATLTLPSASSFGAGKGIYVKKTDGTGAWSIAPASGTVDGLSAVAMYTEPSYAIVSDGTNWQVQGRLHGGWVYVGTTTITASATSVAFSAAFSGDPEIQKVEIDGAISAMSTGFMLGRVTKAGTLQTTNYSDQSVYTYSGNAPATYNTTSDTALYLTPVQVTNGHFNVLLDNVGSTDALRQDVSWRAGTPGANTVYSGTGSGICTSSGTVAGFTFIPSAGMTSGVFRQRAFRQ